MAGQTARAPLPSFITMPKAFFPGFVGKQMLSDASQRWKHAGFRRVEKPQGFSTTGWFARFSAEKRLR